MIVDILSDLHLDFYFPQEMEASIDAVKSIFDPIFFENQKRKIGDVLIIAGDIGHYNHQNIQILKILQAEYYQHIVSVLGNHDYYLINRIAEDNYDKDSFNRIKEMRSLINAEENMHCLNGTVVTIDGVKFGGCDSSYNNAYLKAYFPLVNHPTYNNNLWKSSINDYANMGGVNQYNQIYKLELPKIEAVYKECDIMITHVNPSFLHDHMSQYYMNQKSNTFFCFNGHRYMQDGTMKYWVFGHTHDTLEYEHEGVKCICNPFGYPAESSHGKDTRIKSIEI
ncbi:metallophosphoesterase [Sulfurimonas sp. SAG-AH-194-I05]|nr:metallophosphoesterase [Sulfurimonas sp. SAG-AH-194-I05]MDF1876129.1 metallophosphoesterase [Sulfurimonas sp. SAG-AH-194-I05]